MISKYQQQVADLEGINFVDVSLIYVNWCQIIDYILCDQFDYLKPRFKLNMYDYRMTRTHVLPKKMQLKNLKFILKKKIGHVTS